MSVWKVTKYYEWRQAVVLSSNLVETNELVVDLCCAYANMPFFRSVSNLPWMLEMHLTLVMTCVLY